MIEELSLIKEQLFDAPTEVKESFNKVVNYFGLIDNVKEKFTKTFVGFVRYNRIFDDGNKLLSGKSFKVSAKSKEEAKTEVKKKFDEFVSKSDIKAESEDPIIYNYYI